MNNLNNFLNTDFNNEESGTYFFNYANDSVVEIYYYENHSNDSYYFDVISVIVNDEYLNNYDTQQIKNNIEKWMD